jgi:hypothetical protein
MQHAPEQGGIAPRAIACSAEYQNNAFKRQAMTHCREKPP